MQLEEYNSEFLNLTEFINLYRLDMILNNDLINHVGFELYNFESQYLNMVQEIKENPEDYGITSDIIEDGDLDQIAGITAEELILENENYQYFIIDENDLKYWEKYTNYDIFYNEDYNIYLIGINHYGMAWSFFFTTAPRPGHMKIKKYDEILNAAGE